MRVVWTCAGSRDLEPDPIAPGRELIACELGEPIRMAARSCAARAARELSEPIDARQ